MRKLLKILGIILGIVVLAILPFVITVNVRGIPTYENKAPNQRIEITEKRNERGEKLVRLLCANCHMNPETGKLTGKHMIDAPPEFGMIYAPNITRDPEYGIGSYTDGEIIYLLRTGIKKDGQYAPPYMAKLPHMSTEDINSIVSFLRSGHDMVLPARVPDKPCEPSFLTKFLCMVAFEPLEFPEASISQPDTNNAVEWGKYLVYNLDCWTCHSADFKELNVAEPDKTPGYMGGGNAIYNLDGDKLLTQNLTPHKTGLGDWNEQQFIKALRTGMVDGQDALRYPMVPYTRLTEPEAKAIWAYIQTIPPIDNSIERTVLD